MDNVSAPAYLIFDGECGFCRRWIERWKAAVDDRVVFIPYQEAASRFPEIPRDRFAQAVHFFEPKTGRWSRGAEAVFRALSTSRGGRWPLFLYRLLPGFAPVSEWIYRWVAAHRSGLTRITNWIWGPHLVPPGESGTVWIFLRILGAIYGIAFVSLWVQISGLAGHWGIYPASEFLSALEARYGATGYWIAPTIFWFGSGDGMLAAACAVGTLAAALLLLGFMPLMSLFVLWALYLSLATVCRDFLWFQWDGLLLETGFLALLVAPAGGWSRPGRDAPSRLGLFLLRWLLFRLLVASAMVKLASHDTTWRSLTALEFHYQTQPLPPWTAWYAHHLPAEVQRLSALLMFCVEGIAPFFLFGPRRIRFAAAGLIAGLQMMIFATGNYGFFNLLTLALCLLALDDGVWPAAWAWIRTTRTRTRPGRDRWLWPAGAVLFLLTLIPLGGSANLSMPFKPLSRLHDTLAPLRLVNPYGLFAVMTTHRPEIIVEGSEDGERWLPYEFRYKPGDVTRRPEFVAPHQPRLDWQMWFAALGGPRSEPWVFVLCQRLLEGSTPVLGLLETNPFPETPPRFVRARLFDYRFTEPSERQASGAWWSREEEDPYSPVLLLREGRLHARDPDE